MADRNTLANLGFALLILGTILILIGLFGFTQFYNCPAGGCPPGVVTSYWSPAGVAFFSGTVLVIIGVILLVIARNMKRDQRTNASSSR